MKQFVSPKYFKQPENLFLMSKKQTKEPKNSKEIVELSEKEHLRLRPSIYVGAVSPTEEDMMLYSDNVLQKKKVIYSPGFYKCFIEIIDNAIDEAKRLKGLIPNIDVYFNSITSEVKVVDFGQGFYRGQDLNKDTGLNKIETAVSRLRAGSNFFNDDTEENLIGTNGVGSSVVNILSDRFTIETVNSDGWFFREWLDFERTSFHPDSKDRRSELGTTVTFIPYKGVFKDGQKWDKTIIHTFMLFKQWLVKNTEKDISNLKFNCFFDDEKLDLDIDFLPKDRVEIKTKLGSVVIYEAYDKSVSASFINSAQCSGIHEKMINDFINDKIGNNLAHHHYECFTALNFPPRLVKFGDQNKTRFASGRWEISELMEKEVFKKIERNFFSTDMFERIVKKIEELNKVQTIKNIKLAKKNSKVKFSSKYTPSQKNEVIFLAEGDCLHQDTEIIIELGNKMINKKMSELKIDDCVLTHKNRLRPITDIQKSIKKKLIIKTSEGDIVSSYNHRFFVYNTVIQKIILIQASELLVTHKMIKNQLSLLESLVGINFIELLYDSTYDFKIVFSNDEILYCTKNHKFTVFEYDTFKMIETQYLKVNDVICRISFS